jgi:hypothetical protein
VGNENLGLSEPLPMVNFRVVLTGNDEPQWNEARRPAMFGRLGRYLPLLGLIIGALGGILGAAYFLGGWDFVAFAISYGRHWNTAWMILSALVFYLVAYEIVETRWFRRFDIKMMPERLQGLVIALVLGSFCLVVPFRDVWTNYWLLRDGRQGTAVVTDARDHGSVGYRYCVDGRWYDGSGHRSVQDRHYANVTPGESTVIYYSASHPSVSQIDHPITMVDGAWPVIIIFMWPFEFMALATVINPGGRFSYKGR